MDLYLEPRQDIYEFEAEFGIPNIVGMVCQNGNYTLRQKPLDNKEAYTNRNKKLTLNSQGIIRVKTTFLDMSAG